jgi:hypothetical protein
MEKNKEPKKFQTLSDILQDKGIKLCNKDGSLRNVIDVLEDMYLKMSPNEFMYLVDEISRTESKEGHIFDKERNRLYRK